MLSVTYLASGSLTITTTISDDNPLSSIRMAVPEDQRSSLPKQPTYSPGTRFEFEKSSTSLEQLNRDGTLLRKLLADYEQLNLENDIILEESACLASGVICNVYRGISRSTGVRYAIKKPRLSLKYERELLRLLERYLGIWAKFGHPNVAKLEGFIYDNKHIGTDKIWPIAFVFSWQENGNVLEYLNKNPKSDIGQIVRDIFARFPFIRTNYNPRQTLGIAKGLQYIHKERAILRDVRSVRVLVLVVFKLN